MLFHKFVIIGSGKTGLDLAQRLAATGIDVLLVEASDIGGSYLFSNDYPREIITNESRNYVKNNQSLPGTNMDEVQTVDYISKRIKQSVSTKYKRIKAVLNKYKNLEVIIGKATFETKNLLNIVKKNGEKVVIAFEYCCICTGKSEINIVDIKGLGEINFLHQHNAFFGEVIPEKLAIIGATKENLEVAEIFTHLGSKVVIFEEDSPEKILPEQDTTAVNYLLQNFLRKGIEFYFNISLREIKEIEKVIEHKLEEEETTENSTALALLPTTTTLRYIQIQDVEENLYDFSHIYCPVIESFVDGINLEKIGIKFSEKGIYCTSGGQTTQKNIWAFGSSSISFKKINIYQQLNNFVEKHRYNLNKVENGNLSRSLVMLNPGMNQNSGEIIDLNFNFEKIDLDKPVATIGLAYKAAVTKYGPIIKFKIVFSDEKEGFLKIIYNEHSKNVVGFAVSGEVCVDLYTALVHFLTKNTSLKEMENTIYNLGYKN
jgi:pyruvate/2-oxoglutarate dehydrogenase complex dihydrolipoamide dehydrogenase (E3) component